MLGRRAGKGGGSSVRSGQLHVKGGVQNNYKQKLRRQLFGAGSFATVELDGTAVLGSTGPYSRSKKGGVRPRSGHWGLSLLEERGGAYPQLNGKGFCGAGLGQVFEKCKGINRSWERSFGRGPKKGVVATQVREKRHQAGLTLWRNGRGEGCTGVGGAGRVWALNQGQGR